MCLECCLKVETVEIARMSAGSWIHAYGAANENDLERNVGSQSHMAKAARRMLQRKEESMKTYEVQL